MFFIFSISEPPSLRISCSSHINRELSTVKMIIASLREVPNLFLILMIFIFLLFWRFSTFWNTASIYFLLPITWARIKSVTENFIKSNLCLTFVASIYCPTPTSIFIKKISISDSIQDTILVFNIEYLITFASLSGTYFCFLSVV